MKLALLNERKPSGRHILTPLISIRFLEVRSPQRTRLGVTSHAQQEVLCRSCS